MSNGPSEEAKIRMAIDAIRSNRVKSIRAAFTIFGASRSSIQDRINGKIPPSECTPNSKILNLFEEEVLVKYLLDKDDRGFGIIHGQISIVKIVQS